MSLVIGTGDLLSVRLNYSSSNLPDVAFNILHYKVNSTSGTAPALSTALAAVGQAMFNKWSALWAPAAAAEIQMSGVSVTDVFPLPRSVTTTYTPGAPVPGDETSDPLPLQDAPTLLKKTDVGMRWGTGRLFYPGLAESMQAEGALNAAASALLQTMGAALKDNVTVTSGGWTAVLGPVLKRGPEDNPVSLTPITSGRLSDPIIKSMKTRRPGKGI